MKCSKETLEEFWLLINEEYPKISEKALKILLQCSTSCLCELGLSTPQNTKAEKSRAKLVALEEDMRVCIVIYSSLYRSYYKKNKNTQSQKSH